MRLETASIPLLEALISEGIVLHESKPGVWRALAVAGAGAAGDGPPLVSPPARCLDPTGRRNTGSAVVDRDLIASKLAELHGRIQRVKVNVPESAEALQANRNALDLVSFNLMLSVQVCADLASHLIADDGYAGIDVARCFDAAQHGLGDLESFARQISAWAQAQRGG